MREAAGVPVADYPCVEPEVVEFGEACVPGPTSSAWRCAMSSG